MFAGSRRVVWFRTTVIVVPLGVLLVAGTAAAYAAGVFADQGRFATAPPPCSVISQNEADQFFHASAELSPSPTSATCEMFAVGAPDERQLTVEVTRVSPSGASGAPRTAAGFFDAEMHTWAGYRSVRPLPGVGEQAAVSVSPAKPVLIEVLLRVSNLLVSVRSTFIVDEPGRDPVALTNDTVTVASAIAHRLETR